MSDGHAGKIVRRAVAAAAVAMCALVLAPLAVAGSGKGSILSTYGGNSRQLIPITQHQGHGNLGAGLPYTGMDIALVVAAGVGILVLGFALRRLGRRNAES